ncbi:hypothetical protein MANES_13G007100v8 [Manihot esculenta]|uniref:Uncharacterized protein n=1 Tax=Manihot esculenta TaxID=3983 RepID=A0ACB7GJM4_MANES|nr:hypothetical protein MANES_13G007100v8 [Manihot esculenta]
MDDFAANEPADPMEEEPAPELSLSQVLDDVDRFLETLSETKYNFNPPEVPNSVESFLTIVEKNLAKCDSKNQEKDLSFYECLIRISRLTSLFSGFKTHPLIATPLNRSSSALHHSMSLLDSEFRTILESGIHNQNQNNSSDPKTPKASKQPPFGTHQHENSDRGGVQEEEFPAYSLVSISKMNRIATAMISLGYEKECCMAYNMIRNDVFNHELDKLGLTHTSIEDVQRMQWENLEGEITAWIDILSRCYSVLFSREMKLCNSIFSEYPSVSKRLFSDVAFAVTTRFLNFAEAVALTKQSAEKLFKFLDMYETLTEMIPVIDTTNHPRDLKGDICAAKSLLGEAAVSIFSDLEYSIRRDHTRTPVPSGAVHPLTRYTMNYLKYACEYKDTLEQVFLDHQKMEEGNAGAGKCNQPDGEITEDANEDGKPKTSPFSMQLNIIIDLLDENLEMKSKFYRDPALRYVFLMNNGRYILQKIKGSTETNHTIGANWCKKRTTDLRQYHKGYTRESWSILLQCLSHAGLLVHGKVVKHVLKERFKMFNSMLDEIHKTQSTWIVTDKQLQSELRVSISAVVIPAYRSFLGRFQQCLSGGRQTEKYVKYQPEDIEKLIDELSRY